MGDIIAQSRVRYPPFESSLKRPEYLPIIVREVVLETDVGDLDATMKNVDLLLEDVRKNPARYTRVLSKKRKPYEEKK